VSALVPHSATALHKDAAAKGSFGAGKWLFFDYQLARSTRRLKSPGRARYGGLSAAKAAAPWGGVRGGVAGGGGRKRRIG
jgi:hypothetical protein